VQLEHLLQVAAEAGLEDCVRSALAKLFVASIGPTTSEALKENNIRVDFEPSHPKMGVLVQEAAARIENAVGETR
jgi:uroporphyrinogen-III synthase